MKKPPTPGPNAPPMRRQRKVRDERPNRGVRRECLDPGEKVKRTYRFAQDGVMGLYATTTTGRHLFFPRDGRPPTVRSKTEGSLGLPTHEWDEGKRKFDEVRDRPPRGKTSRHGS